MSCSVILESRFNFLLAKASASSAPLAFGVIPDVTLDNLLITDR